MSNRSERGGAGSRPPSPKGGEAPECYALVWKVRVPSESSLLEREPTTAIAIIIIMHVLVGEPLSLDSGGWSPVFEYLPTRSVWVYGYVPSCLTLKQHCSLEARWLRRLPGTKRPPGREAGSV
jgi:hypothetical protein